MATVVPRMAIMAHIPQMKVRRLPDYVSLYLIGYNVSSSHQSRGFLGANSVLHKVDPKC
jgi:hypothetical protein